MSYIVGITMRSVVNDTYYEVRNEISNDYLKFLSQYDIIPVLIPNVLKDPAKYFKTMGCQALILSGGENILSIVNRDEEGSIEFKSDRDKTEYKLLTYCINESFPVLGICRGMQFINMYFGGETVNLNEILTPQSHVNKNHQIKLLDNIEFNKIHNVNVNSYHNNGITFKSISKDLSIFTVADNEVVEGLYYKDYKVIGIQWHPERSKSLIDEIIVNKWLSYIEE